MKNTLNYRFVKTTKSLYGFALFAFILSSCQKDIKTTANQLQATQSVNDVSARSIQAGQMVLIWNNAINTAVNRNGVQTGKSISPPPDSRILAMVTVVMHDALNTIVPRYERYASTDDIQTGASPAAAIAQAAHDVIDSLLPLQQTYVDSLLAASLSSIPDGAAKTSGIELGKSAAHAMMMKRSNDGSATAQYVVAQGTEPGQYRSTPPNDVTGFIGLPGWGNVMPFALQSGSQFRTKIAPYPIKSIAYSRDYNELKTAGSSVSNVRTADETQYAQFWIPNIPFMFDNITTTLIAQNNLQDGWQIARLLALVEMAEADANIACFDGKYYYFFWRPYTAIHLGDSDGNNLTIADTTWQPLVNAIPASPDYPSNHALNGAAAAAVVALFFGKDNFNFDVTSPFLPGVTRSYTSLQQVAREISLSRIYVGFHFRHAVDEGEMQGYKVGTYVFKNALKPL